MFDRSTGLKNKLRAGGIAVGAWLTFSSPAVAEILGGAGLDWIVIDAEHAPFSLESIEHILMVLSSCDAAPLVRVPSNNPTSIKQVLDLGAEGVVVPDIRSPEEARQAVAACRYPPEGIRGFGPRRASDYFRQTDEYIRTANEGVFIAIQIEHADAVEALPDILAVPGIDVAILGPMDLSASVGLLGQLDHPRVAEAIERVVIEAQRAGVPLCVPMSKPASVLLDWASRGCRFIRIGTDHVLLRRAITQALAELWSHRPADAN